jgi:hypothetical protein
MRTLRADRHILRVEWVTVQVRWRKGRGGGVKDGVVVRVVVYLEGRRMVIGDGEGVVMVVGCLGILLG